MNWEPVYALLIFTSTIITYGCGRLIASNIALINRKWVLIVSLIINFGILFLFKYYTFLGTSITELFEVLGINMNIPKFDYLLPVGISFYTFQAVGYSIDVYRKHVSVERDFLKYALFVSFFPQLVAGPIERAKNLLPQFHREHMFEYNRAVEGFRLILWGYFMKVCVADRLSTYVDAVYNNISHHNGTTILFATLLFSFQIYCDFAGYSNIAIGTAKVLGFDLMTNFKRPYFASSITDFWRRWHISLSTWFKDYVYIPLGGNRVSKLRNYLNLLITFIVSGIWHGANWTFVIWGALHGIYQVFEKLFQKNKNKANLDSSFSKFLKTTLTFSLVLFSWIFFRANNVSDAFIAVQTIFLKRGNLFINNIDSLALGILGILILIFFEVGHEKNSGHFILLEKPNIFIRWSAYILLIFALLLFGVFDGGQFIYFQF